MSQISPPIRILLAGCVLFMAAWFTVLKPGEPETPAMAPADPAAQAEAAADGAAPGQPASAAGQAVQQAQAAAGQAPATSAPPATVSPSTSAAPSPAAKAAGDAAKASLPKVVARHLDRDVIALAFVNDGAAEDRRVRGSMRKVHGHRGKVWAHTASIDDVSKYTPITRGAQVDQSPTVLVVDRHRNVTPLVGFVDSVSINQAVVDALLADGHPVDDSPYLQKLEGVCSTANRRVRELRDPRNLRELRGWLHDFDAIAHSFLRRTRGVKAPAKYRALDRDLKRFYAADAAAVAKVRRWLDQGRYPVAAASAMITDLKRQSRKLDLELAGLGMDDCR